MKTIFQFMLILRGPPDMVYRQCFEVNNGGIFYGSTYDFDFQVKFKTAENAVIYAKILAEAMEHCYNPWEDSLGTNEFELI